jgi:GT2 family glycosyltransferase/glycosyltransferase involved in cell wall biosynthesis
VTSPPTISVVIVNLNGQEYLERCITSLLNQDYPAEQVEIILVDNASTDGSLAYVAAHFPMVKVIPNTTNTGFAPAVNQGADAATGRYLALINNDAYADSQWLSAMLATLDRYHEKGVVCVGATILDWQGERIDFAGGGASFYGFGHQFFVNLPFHAKQHTEQDMLFACGGAMLVDRRLFLDIGGFDPTYFAYFEDVDFGWRLWLAGYRVVLSPAAIVYHRHHGVSRHVPQHQINALLERNALITILKNYDDATLSHIAGPALLLAIQRLIAFSDSQDRLDWQMFEIGAVGTSTGEGESEGKDTGICEEPLAISPTTMSYIAALRSVMRQFPHIWQQRQHVQSLRQRPEHEILPLLHYPFGPHHCTQLLSMQTLNEMFRLDEVFAEPHRRRILIISSDPLSDNLAGQGIRVVEMAHHLARYCEVIVAAPKQADVVLPGVTFVSFDHEDKQAIESLAGHAEVVILQGYSLYRHHVIEQMRKIVVVDLYDPFHLESLEFFKHKKLDESREKVGSNLEVINQQLLVGDFFICASERQRDLWLGALSSRGRLTPAAYADDPTFRNLIDVVPFGLPATPPTHTQQVLKGVHPHIGKDDKVILWGGGVWDWLDPLTVIGAMNLIRQQRPDVKLFFMGRRHPNAFDVQRMMMYDHAISLVRNLGLQNTVLFNSQWVPYSERANYFLEADIGVSAHLNHVETRFAFRTRLLDYIWCGLPMVVSVGDTLSETVEEYGVGRTVEIGDIEGFAAALLHRLEQPNLREQYAPAFAELQEAYSWQQTLAPLIDFCRNPRCAPDQHRYSLLDTYQQRIQALDDIVATKNSHIAHLEHILKQLESGRVMRALRWLRRGK